MTDKQRYIVSARKYRPATFKTVVGQRALTATLKNAISGGRLAQAYLFCGPRGVGKTSCARIFAKTINCQNRTTDGEACGECESCKAIEKGNSFNLIELDAASNNSVDDIRNITDQVNIPAQDGAYRVFIIDEVHMLSNAAFNAFLKTLEEPPKNVVFILATTERHKVIPTILSRCQVYDFKRITVNDIIDHLEYVGSQEGATTEREALGVIALKADGAMRDALSIFDQVVASTQGNVSYQATIDALNVLDHEYYFHLLDIFRKGDVAEALLTFKEITDKGFDAQFFINGLASHIRDLMVAADPRTISLLETSSEMEQRYSAQATSLPLEWYYTAMRILNDADFNYRTSGNKRLLVELTLIRLSRLLSAPVTLQSAGPSATAPPQPAAAKPSVQAPAPASTVPQPSQMRQAPSPAPSTQTPPFVAPTQQPQVSRQGVNESAVKRNPAKRPTSFRLSDAAMAQPPLGHDGKRTEKFTDDQIRSAWESFISSHPEQRILTGAMRGKVPARETGSEDLNIVVDHPAQKQAFESAMPELLSFLKDNLSNDMITLKVTVDEDKNSQRHIPPRELLKKIVSNNAPLADFLKELDAELE